MYSPDDADCQEDVHQGPDGRCNHSCNLDGVVAIDGGSEEVVVAVGFGADAQAQVGAHAFLKSHCSHGFDVFWGHIQRNKSKSALKYNEAL